MTDARHRILHLLPWLLTLLIFAWLFRRIPLQDLLAALRQMRLGPYLAIMVPYSLLYCLLDTWVLRCVLVWFHRPVPYRRVLPVRAAAYILALLNPGLGQGAVAFTLHRREHLPFLEVAGSMAFLAAMEVGQLALYAGVGIVAWQHQFLAAFAPLYGVLAVVVLLGCLYVRTGLTFLAPVLTMIGRWRSRNATYQYRPAPPQLSILHTLQQARARHYALTLLYKAPNFLLAVLVHYLALRQFSVYAPLSSVLAFLPIIFLVASLPVTVAHLGTSQAAWLYFFASYGPASHILAYSLLAHVTFMLMNSLLGLCFLRQALRDVTPS